MGGGLWLAGKKWDDLAKQKDCAEIMGMAEAGLAGKTGHVAGPRRGGPSQMGLHDSGNGSSSRGGYAAPVSGVAAGAKNNAVQGGISRRIKWHRCLAGVT
jgi:hypothetical protein